MTRISTEDARRYADGNRGKLVRDLAADLLDERERAAEFRTGQCAFCEHRVPKEEMAAHMLACEKHPLAAERARAEKAEAACAAMRVFIDEVGSRDGRCLSCGSRGKCHSYCPRRRASDAGRNFVRLDDVLAITDEILRGDGGWMMPAVVFASPSRAPCAPIQ